MTKKSQPIRHDRPAEEWANAPVSEQDPLKEQSYNFDEGPFAPDYWEDNVLEAGQPEDD